MLGKVTFRYGLPPQDVIATLISMGGQHGSTWKVEGVKEEFDRQIISADLNHIYYRNKNRYSGSYIPGFQLEFLRDVAKHFNGKAEMVPDPPNNDPPGTIY